MKQSSIIILTLILCCTSFFSFSQKIDNKLIWIKSGKTIIGNSEEQDAQPIFETKVKGFWMQEHEVTNEEFLKFVTSTDYITLAEENGGSYVFNVANDVDSLFLSNAPWWTFVEGVNWKNPWIDICEFDEIKNHPVVHISHEDASNYCEWLQMRLPTEIEWEYASRLNVGVDSFNHWQGDFPDTNWVTDNYKFTAPVKSFPSGKLGIYDLQGNVWEWCLDPYHQNAYQYAKKWGVESNRSIVDSYYDEFSPDEETFVIRGGSFLCAENFCEGYKLGRRMRSSSKMTFQHIGFRCVKEGQKQ